MITSLLLKTEYFFNNIRIMNKDLWNITLDYLLESPKKFLDWIDVDKINWSWLSLNPAAIHLLEKNIDKISWKN